MQAPRVAEMGTPAPQASYDACRSANQTPNKPVGNTVQKARAVPACVPSTYHKRPEMATVYPSH